jgi:hypothetical protein
MKIGYSQMARMVGTERQHASGLRMSALNVTEGQLRSYIEAFHGSLEATAAQFLPSEYRCELLHASLLPARITGYVSTQLGVAIEYERAVETSIRLVSGSARVEDLFVQAPSSVRNTGPIFRIAAREFGLAGGTLRGGFPFRLYTDDASILLQDVAFEIGSWRREVEFAEVFANRNTENWSRASAESRAKDEVLVAMVHVRRARERNISVAEYIAKFKDKTILVLGDYDDEGVIRLAVIAEVLSTLGYEPILVKDIPDHPHHDLVQKVVALAAICRFIVVDDSSKSGHVLEVQLCKQNSWVTVLLRAEGKHGSWVTAGAEHSSNVIHRLMYDPSSPERALGEAVEWAEAKIKELERKFKGTYPWRADG